MPVLSWVRGPAALPVTSGPVSTSSEAAWSVLVARTRCHSPSSTRLWRYTSLYGPLPRSNEN